ncbi:radical SAM/SPASM domain-containing protein [Spirochaetota bacterium]
MSDLSWRNSYLKLSPNVALKRLEEPYIYHMGRDELYEIDERAEKFMLTCDGSSTGAELTSDGEFVEFCIDEGLLEACAKPVPVNNIIDIAPRPSLRYLELQLLHKCNIRCRHCYLGEQSGHIMELGDALKICREFASSGGLRLLISGGEPLLYPHLEELIHETSKLKIRRVILTNGTLINEDNISRLNVENIQFSLDGWEKGNDYLRGSGNFAKTIRGIDIAGKAGIPVSIASMIHSTNLNEFEQMEGFIKEIEATEWGIDIMCEAGLILDNTEIIPPLEDAVPLMRHAFGGGYHGSSDGYACGRHLMTVMPNCDAVKCGFYTDQVLGNARNGLINSWMKLSHIPLSKLECMDCDVIDECAGGCRFRASHRYAPDTVMCRLFKQKSFS